MFNLPVDCDEFIIERDNERIVHHHGDQVGVE